MTLIDLFVVGFEQIKASTLIYATGVFLSPPENKKSLVFRCFQDVKKGVSSMKFIKPVILFVI